MLNTRLNDSCGSCLQCLGFSELDVGEGLLGRGALCREERRGARRLESEGGDPEGRASQVSLGT